MTMLYDTAIHLLRLVFDHRIHGPHLLDAATYFPAAAKFASSWMAIRDEALVLAQRMAAIPRFHELMEEQAEISAADAIDWRVFVLKAYGVDFQHNMARCPSLAALLRGSPEVLSATLSFLAPGKHVPRHRGPFRGIMRFHLGLAMPRTADGRLGSVIEIGDKQYSLDNGDTLLWDDTFPHEVWNRTEKVRIALLLDVWRPGMPADMRILSRLIIFVVGCAIRIRGIAAR